MASLLRGASRICSGEIRFIAGLYLLLAALFAALRLLLLLRNANLAEQVAGGELVNSFLVGLRFDLAVASYLLIPLFLLAGRAVPAVARADCFRFRGSDRRPAAARSLGG